MSQKTFNHTSGTGTHQVADGTYRFVDNLLHSDPSPAIVGIRRGEHYEEYWKKGVLDRDEGPAVLHMFKREEWWRWGERHRLNGPAVRLAHAELYPLTDPKFTNQKLPTDPVCWTEFPFIQEHALVDHINSVFGQQNARKNFGGAFNLMGDYGMLPARLLKELSPMLSDGFSPLYQVSYERDFRRCLELLDPENDPFMDKPSEKEILNSEENPCSEKSEREWPDRTDSPGIDDRVGILDCLGTYCCQSKTITLHLCAIVECAERLDKRLNSFCQLSAMSLATLVFYHELGHAIDHHLRGGNPNDDLGGTMRAETIAQLVALAVTGSYGVRALEVEKALSKNQPRCYSNWRKICSAPKVPDLRRLLAKGSKFYP